MSAALPSVLTSTTVSRIKRVKAVDTVRARILLAVSLGLLQPGERLPPESELAKTLDVGEITARRAIESLAEEGVVERRRGRSGGTFVASSGPTRAADAGADAVAAYLADSDEVHRLIEVRLLLEAALTHHAALRASPAEIEQLQRHVDDAGAAATWADYHLADERFHRGVARASGLDWAIGYYDTVLSDLYAYFLPYPIAYLHDTNREHAALVDALARHDPVRAVSIIEAHVAVLHESMFVGLQERQAAARRGAANDAGGPVRSP
jgi:DNA-binding FadR family transcriptional regulator